MLNIYFRWNIVIPIVRDLEVDFDIYDDTGALIDFTLYNVSAQLRAGQSISSTLIATFTITKDATGNLLLTLTDEETETSAFTPQKAHYDVKVTEISTGLEKTWIYGEAQIVGSVTT